MDKKIVEIIQAVEEIARRICKEEQHTENDRMRAIARCECRSILKEQYEMESAHKKPYTRAGEKWTECENRILKEELTAFFTKTAADHERSYGAIVSRIRQIYDKEY